MLTSRVTWFAWLIGCVVFSGSATALEVNRVKAFAEAEQPSSSGLSLTKLAGEELPKEPLEDSAQVEDDTSKDFDSSVVTQSADKAVLKAHEMANTVYGETKGQWEEVGKKDLTGQIHEVREIINRIKDVRETNEAVVGNQEVDSKIEKAVADIKKLFSMAYKYAGRWEIFFLEEHKCNELALLQTIRQGFKEFGSDSLLVYKVRGAAQTALHLLDHLPTATFGYAEARKVSEMMETTLSETTSRNSLKLPFIQKAPQFLRALSQLEHNITKNPCYEARKVSLSLTNKWVRKLQTYASRDIKGGLTQSKAMASLKIVTQDPRIPEWIQCQAKRAVDYLNSLQSCLASQIPRAPSKLKALRRLSIDFPVTGNMRTFCTAFQESVTLADDLLTPHVMDQEDQLLLLRPEKLRSCNEEDLMGYMQRACSKQQGAEQIMLTMKWLNEFSEDLRIRTEVQELLELMFDPYQPTVWLVFFSWIAKKAQKDNSYHESLTDIDGDMIQIIRTHINSPNVQNVSEAVEDLIFEAMFPPELNFVESLADSFQEQDMLASHEELEETIRRPQKAYKYIMKSKNRSHYKIGLEIKPHLASRETASETTNTSHASYSLPQEEFLVPQSLNKGKEIAESPEIKEDPDSPYTEKRKITRPKEVTSIYDQYHQAPSLTNELPYITQSKQRGKTNELGNSSTGESESMNFSE